MLKLLAMLIAGKALIFFSFLLSNFLQPAAGTEVYLFAPAAGDALQGAVTISGGMDVKDFVSYEVAFAYDDGREIPAWFLIKRDINQVRKGALATWDTTTITDGHYQLRVLVKTSAGRQIIETVKNLRVSNYSPLSGGVISGGAPAPTLQSQSKSVQSTPDSGRAALALPANPAELTSPELSGSVARGLTGVLLAFAVIGLYLAARRGLRKKE